MTKTMPSGRPLSGMILTTCLLLASCGGTRDAVPAPGRFSTGTGSEINAGNALLVARVANLAVVRYLAYRDLTATIYDRALSLSPAVPASVNCGAAADGQLGVTTLSATGFDVMLRSCRASPAVVLDSGVVVIDSFARAAGGSPVSFNTTPNAIRITDSAGTSTVSGSISYQRALTGTTAGPGQSEAHTGQLDYTSGGKTDQYRNIAITTGQIGSGATSSVAVAISRLEIATPRVAVAKIQVVTPGPLTLGTPTTATASDILLATSAADGSLVQIDYIGTTAFRLRCWDSRGNPLLDVMKNDGDADVVAADAAAAG